MKEFAIDARQIGEGARCFGFVIAEGGDSHLGNLGVAREMCRQARLARADAIESNVLLKSLDLEGPVVS